jgi:hypothetical protein
MTIKLYRVVYESTGDLTEQSQHATHAAAARIAGAAQRKLERANPGTRLLCSYQVQVRHDGVWHPVDDDGYPDV